MINGDTLCRWPLAALLARHRERRPAATLLLATRPDPCTFGGGVAVDRRGRILRFRGPSPAGTCRRRVFAGAHVLEPRLLSRLPEGASDVISALYEPLLESGEPIESLTTRRRWHDLGTPRRLLEGVLDWALPAEGRGAFLAQGAVLESAAQAERAVLEAGARIARGSRVEGALLLPGAQVEKGCAVEDTILGPGVVLQPGSCVSHKLLTRAAEAGLAETPLADPGH